MSIFKITNTVDGDDDPMFVEAETEAAALKIFRDAGFNLPANMLRVAVVPSLPDGHELFNP